MQEKTKNDRAWEYLFDKYKILQEISDKGYFEIRSTQINEVRESRLMAKFDHHVNLPKIFRDNHLSILPVSRSQYIIGYFDTHLEVKYSSEIEEIPFEPPIEIESIDCTNLYSESSALSFAFNAGIIDDLINENTFYTVSGRMSTEVFSFNIKNTISDFIYSINVENSQCEVDGGFESKNYFLLLEVKNYSVDDFLIRQLYYPYRLWASKISKRIIPILMTYSNDVFSFFIYKFETNLDYNSIILIKQKNYIVAPEKIHLDDVSDIFNKITITSESRNVPFPQADIFERVVDLLSLLVTKDLTKEEITENYQFDKRQTQYYTDAGRYIGLVNKYLDSATGKITFCLTAEGKTIMKKRHKAKVLALINKILQAQVFYRVFEVAIADGILPSKNNISEIMSASELNIYKSTITRRATTVQGWINWIWSQID